MPEKKSTSNVKKTNSPMDQISELLGCTSMINAAGQNGDLAFAKQVFQSAERNHIRLDVISYNSMINAAGQNGDLAFAKQVFLSHTANHLIHRLIKVNNYNGEYSIDLHGCNYFTALLYLEEYYGKWQESHSIKIIFGRGSHSQFPVGPGLSHPVKAAVITFLNNQRLMQETVKAQLENSNHGYVKIVPQQACTIARNKQSFFQESSKNPNTAEFASLGRYLSHLSL